MTTILDKTKEWSDRFGSTLRASAQTQFAHLYKGAVGGIEHVISVDNGAYYMEMWRDGSDTYYATTGAAIKPLPGLAKGARLDEALDRFFTLMATVEKDKAAMKQRLHMQPKPTKKAIPKKIKRLLGLKKRGPGPYTDMPNASKPPGWKPPKIKRPSETSVPGGSVWAPSGQARKRIVAKVDPEIGPSHSVGHKKPSDLSPESGVSKLVKRVLANIAKTSAQDFTRYAPHGPTKPHTPPSATCPNCPKKPPVKKNVVALTAPGGVGNQPGSGRVKPGTPSQTYQSPQGGFSGRRMGGGPGAPGTSGAGIKSPPKMQQQQGANFGQKTTQRRAPYVGGRPQGPSPLTRGRKIDGITGGRVSGPSPAPGVDRPQSQITPVKVPKRTPQGHGYGRLSVPRKMIRKDCACAAGAEVAKAVSAVSKAR